MKFKHSLMHNNFTRSDMQSVSKLLKKNIVLTQASKVREFELKWSKWLGTKFSVFVNSGSSANLITLSILRSLNKNKKE